MEELPLGRQVESPREYAPQVLVAVPRNLGRELLGLESWLPFSGVDRWVAWEFAWHDWRGRRRVGILELSVPAESPAIVESKSLKLYLNSCFYHRFGNVESLCEELQESLEEIVGAPLSIEYRDLQRALDDYRVAQPEGRCLDDIEAAETAQLGVEERHPDLAETCFSHCFRSLCPVTGQPDWASILIDVRGVRLEASGLLAYLLGFAEHQAFHEHCVETIFMDIWKQCQPAELAVGAAFTRRGGIEINPHRTSSSDLGGHRYRLVRQ